MLNSEMPNGKFQKVIRRGKERGDPFPVDGYVDQAFPCKRLVVKLSVPRVHNVEQEFSQHCSSLPPPQ